MRTPTSVRSDQQNIKISHIGKIRKWKKWNRSQFSLHIGYIFLFKIDYFTSITENNVLKLLNTTIAVCFLIRKRLRRPSKKMNNKIIIISKYKCMCVCARTCKCARINVCAYVCTRVRMCMFACVRVYEFVCVCICVHVKVCMCMCECEFLWGCVTACICCACMLLSS